MKKRSILFIVLLALSFSAFSSTGKKEVRLWLVDTVSLLADQTETYVDVGLSPAFLPVEDARKEFDSVLSVPQIYSLTSDGVPCYSNSYGSFTRSVVIALGYRVAGGSTYAISSSLIDNFDPTSIIIVEDKVTGAFHDLRQGAYFFSSGGPQQSDTRFYLHISYPPSVNPTPAGCSNNDGVISVTEDSTIIWSSCQLFDAENVFVNSYNNIKGNFKFSGLLEGSYNLAFVYGTYSAIKPLYVGGNQILVSDSASTIYASVGQAITFYSNAHNASHYNWDFGDNTTVNGVANIQYSYDAPGTYTVAVLCTNDAGCSAYGYITVYISEAAAIPSVALNSVKIGIDRKNVVIYSTTSASSTIDVYNLSGQLISATQLDSSPQTINLNNQASGVYFVRIINAGGSLTRKIFLE